MTVHKYFVHFLCFVFASSFVLLCADTAAQSLNKPPVPEAEKQYLSYAINEQILPYARLDATPNTVTTRTDTYGNSVWFFTHGGQTIKNGGRASEIAIDYPYKEGETLRYSWRMNLPTSFNPDAANRWWLVARWNAQPNPKMGEKPESFLALNPAILLSYKFVGGVDTFSLSYGVPNSITSDAFSVTRNEWVKIDMEITWSTSSKGKARLFINDSKLPVKEVSGHNMYGKYHNLFRLGTSRDPAISTEANIGFGDISIERIEP